MLEGREECCESHQLTQHGHGPHEVTEVVVTLTTPASTRWSLSHSATNGHGAPEALLPSGSRWILIVLEEGTAQSSLVFM